MYDGNLFRIACSGQGTTFRVILPKKTENSAFAVDDNKSIFLMS